MSAMGDLWESENFAEKKSLSAMCGKRANDMTRVHPCPNRHLTVKAGHGHVVLLTGDAGIGKSRLVQTLKDSVAHEPHTRWECRSLPYYHNTALYPLTHLFQRTLQWQPDETPDEN